MSEKPPISPNTPDNDPPNNSETGPISAHGSDRVESERLNRTSSCMGQGAVDSFMDMTDRGKEIIGNAYEKLYDVPVVNRLAGKIGIAYKSLWMDRNEKKAVGRKSKMDGLGISMKTLGQSRQRLEASIEKRKQQHMPGAEVLQLKLKVIDKRVMELQNKKDKEQTKFEVKDNQVKRFANERDAIADKLIGRYEEKLVPLEGALDSLQHSRGRINMEFSAANMRNKETMKEVKEMEKEKIETIEALRLMGSSERSIRRDVSIKSLNDSIASIYARMRAEKESLTKARNAIDKEIAKADKKANPHRDKRDEFIRAKQGRPIDMEVETRNREKDVDTHENVQSHQRSEQPAPEATQSDNPSKTFESTRADTNETVPDVSLYASGWNEFLQNKYGKDNSPMLVDVENFLGETGLAGVGVVDGEDFSDVLGKYYSYKRILATSFKEDINDFLKNYSHK